MRHKLLLLLLLVMISLPFASAYTNWNYYNSPADLLQNEWVVFALIFLVFFAIIYFSLSRTMENAKGAVLIISLVISFLLASVFSEKIRFGGYISDSVFTWVSLIALLIVGFLLIKIAISFAGWLFILGFWVLYFIVYFNFEIYDLLPNSILVADWFTFVTIIWELIRWGMIVLTVVAGILTLIAPIIAIFKRETRGSSTSGFFKWLWGIKNNDNPMIRALTTLGRR